MMKFVRVAAAVALTVGVLSGVQAEAATSAKPAATSGSQPKALGTFGAWTAYTFTEGDAKVCYVATQPKKAEGDYSSRGDVFFLVTDRPAEKSFNVVSVIAGYTYKDGSEPTLSIDNKKGIALFTKADRAWAHDDKTDKAITDALKKGSTMVIKGTSSRGTPTVDSYSLKGSGEALNAIAKECPAKG